MEIPYGYLDELFKQARVGGHVEDLSIQHRLKPHVREMYDFTFRRVVDQCRQRKIQSFLLYRPAPIDYFHLEPTKHGEMIRLADTAGFPVLDLWSAFDRSKTVTRWQSQRGTIILTPSAIDCWLTNCMNNWYRI